MHADGLTNTKLMEWLVDENYVTLVDGRLVPTERLRSLVWARTSSRSSTPSVSCAAPWRGSFGPLIKASSAPLPGVGQGEMIAAAGRLNLLSTLPALTASG